MTTRKPSRFPILLALTALVLSSLVTPQAGAASFVGTGALNTNRQNHTATVLPNGKVLVAGGEDSNGNPLASAELYDPASGTWTTTGSLNKARYKHTATLLPNGKVLVAGGGMGSGMGGQRRAVRSGQPDLDHDRLAALRRYGHTATLLPNGKVLVAGGAGSGGSPQRNAALYDPATGKWTTTGSLNRARHRHTATLLPNGKVLVTGTADDNSWPPLSELYDPAGGTWAVTGSPDTLRYAHTATLLPNGKVLVAGGDDGANYLASAELYDPASGVWAATGSLHTAREWHTATLLPNGKVLVAGGTDASSGALASGELYDPASGAWTTTGPLNTPRDCHTATLLPSGKVLVAGGENSNGNALAGAELCDPASGAWTNTGLLNTAHYMHTATLLPNGQVLVAGGWIGSSGVLASAGLYDPASGVWTATGSLNVGRMWHTATLLANGKVLVAGGYNSSQGYDGSGGYLASAELYDPASGVWTTTGLSHGGRANHTATLLPSGKVLVAGGENDASQRRAVRSGQRGLDHHRRAADRALLPHGDAAAQWQGPDRGRRRSQRHNVLAGAELYDPCHREVGNYRWAEHRPLLSDSDVAAQRPGAGRGGHEQQQQHAGQRRVVSIRPAGRGRIPDSLNAARYMHTATLLPNGQVLVAGGWIGPGISTALASAELYDPATGTWTATGSLNTARYGHTATLLANGKVLAAGGEGSASYLTSAELYDVGLGFNAAWQPQIATFTSPLTTNGCLKLTGSRFRGVSEGSGGNGCQDSSADYPVVQLRRLDNEQTLFLLSTNWQTNSFTSAPVSGLPAGWAMATMFVNGIPSTGSMLSLVLPAAAAIGLNLPPDCPAAHVSSLSRTHPARASASWQPRTQPCPWPIGRRWAAPPKTRPANSNSPTRRPPAPRSASTACARRSRGRKPARSRFARGLQRM